MSEHGITHKRSQGLIDFAYEYAKNAHGDQVRKYTDEPYIVHPVDVAKIVSSVTDDCEMICAALLHDVIEDTDVTYDDLIKQDLGFGKGIADLVLELTDVSKPSDGNRKVRKALDRYHLANASRQAKTVKLADLISNSSSICQHDLRFAKTYMKEKLQLLGVLSEGNVILLAEAIKIVADYYRINS